MDAREKAQALMEKALSTTSEEEARTCALTAIRLMKKAGITVSPAESAAPGPHPTFIQKFKELKAEKAMLDRMLLDQSRKIAELEAAARARATAVTVTRPGRTASGRTAKAAEPPAAARWMRAKYDNGLCYRCGIAIWSGDIIWWRGSRKGAICESCRKRETGDE